MKVLAEVFKGIEFIRISNLPEDQKNFVIATVSNDKVIKILKDKIVLKDCLQYHDYLSLYDQYKTQTVSQENRMLRKLPQSSYKLALK